MFMLLKFCSECWIKDSKWNDYKEWCMLCPSIVKSKTHIKFLCNYKDNNEEVKEYFSPKNGILPVRPRWWLVVCWGGSVCWCRDSGIWFCVFPSESAWKSSTLSALKYQINASSEFTFLKARHIQWCHPIGTKINSEVHTYIHTYLKFPTRPWRSCVSFMLGTSTRWKPEGSTQYLSCS